MAVTATKAVWKHSRATGNARLVLMALADCIHERRLQAGHEPEAWPSQLTLARMCRCSRSTVQRALEALEELGEIADSGIRRQRGTIVWRLNLPDLTHSAASDGDVPHVESGVEALKAHLTHSADDLTDSASDLTDSALSPDSPVMHKPEGEPEELHPEDEHRSAPSAADVHALPDDLRVAAFTALSEVQLEVNARELREWRAEVRRVVEEAHGEALELNAILDGPGRGPLREQSVKVLASAGLTLPDLMDGQIPARPHERLEAAA